MSKVSFKHIAGIALTAAAISSTTYAAPLGVWDSSWTDITTAPSSGNSEDWVGSGGYVDPGWGGQDFDAEYLLYKIEGGKLHIGLQTGFDIDDGHVQYNSQHYWGGDIALSFDGATLGSRNTYEYAIDLGFGTQCSYKSRSNGGTCKQTDTVFSGDTAGLYKNVTWNGNGQIGFNSSNPFAMKSGDMVTELLDADNIVGSADEDDTSDQGEGVSYYRMVSIDLSVLASEGITDFSNVDIHWTMTCGNDAIDGHVSHVPEPASIVLLSLGMAGLGLARRRKQS